MMRRLNYCILFLVLSSASVQSLRGQPAENVIVARIRYVFALKAAVDSQCWKTFDELRFEVPLIYYTDSASYVANPTEKFLRLVPSTMIGDEDRLRIFRTTQRLDDQAFHMATGYESGDEDSAGLYNYNEPFMTCSGYEETRRRIPDVASVEQWATMVMHEYFHGFQYRHPALFAHARQFLYFASDSLRRIYRNSDRFKASIDRENALLLRALDAASILETRQHIDSFFVLRKSRRAYQKQRSGRDIAAAETYYELMEGTARYAEWELYKYFGKTSPNPEMASIDTGFHNYGYFRNWRLDRDPWLFKTEKTSYLYATGFNMARLLDKLGIRFRDSIFDRGFSLEALLRNAL